MVGKPGPFQVVDSDGGGLVDSPINPPRRRYSCPNYCCCLDIAAALNWDSFTCRGCSGGIDESVMWKAQLAQKNDKVARKLCDLPTLKPLPQEFPLSAATRKVGG